MKIKFKDIPTSEMRVMWNNFKESRRKRYYLPYEHPDYISIRNRENLIDELFIRFNGPQESLT